MALPFLNPETKQTAFNTTIEVEPLPDHIQIAHKMASEINTNENPLHRREMIEKIRELLLEQLLEEQEFETEKIENSTLQLASIEAAMYNL